MQNEETKSKRLTPKTVFTSSFFIQHSAFVFIALLALAIRLPQLGERPMHTDEAVNAYLTGGLLAGENFRYDPQDRHGPALFVLAEPIVKLLGAKKFSELTETQLRLTPVIVGSATILLFGAGVEMFGFIACLVAALLFAFAPLPVYYSRYFIHETLFVAVTLGLILSGGRMLGKNSVLSAALTGFCAALMLACKETAVIHFFALAIALIIGWLVNRWTGGAPGTESARSVGVQASACPENTLKRELQPAGTVPGVPFAKLIFTALAVFIFTAVLLFTWFGRNWSVFADLLHAIPRFAARAGGEGHAKPFGWYFHLLDPLLILFLLAAAGVYAAICDAVGGVRKTGLRLVIYGVVVTLIYSAIPYKTPWLALNLWLPLTLLCGFGVAAIWEQIKNPAGRWGVAIAGACLLATLATQTKLLVFDQPADEKNPYAYAHTTEDLLGLPVQLAELARQNKISSPRIAVVAADAWPLPWYLRKFSQVGYWQPGQETGDADYFITTTDVSGKLAERLKNFRPDFFGVRPNVLLVLWSPPAKQP
jgi:uncharacterized protein (TIGR03663 family)